MDENSKFEPNIIILLALHWGRIRCRHRYKSWVFIFDRVNLLPSLLTKKEWFLIYPIEHSRCINLLCCCYSIHHFFHSPLSLNLNESSRYVSIDFWVQFHLKILAKFKPNVDTRNGSPPQLILVSQIWFKIRYKI